MDVLEEARRLGRLEAERHDLALREREGSEREKRLALLSLGVDEPVWEPPSRSTAAESSSTVWRLQQDVERLAAFHRAVVHSKAWRVIQALRRPFGRAW